MASKHFNDNSHPVPLQATKSQGRKVPDLSASASNTGRSQLGADFKPSEFSVMCGRGNYTHEYVGNNNFRELASMFVARYARASSKGDRSEIVSKMVGMIHEAGGTFCKLEEGVWFKVPDHYAREKTGALLRDMVYTQQRSPVKAKKAKVKSACPRIQKQNKAQIQQIGHTLVDGTAGHSDDSTPTQAQCGHQLVDGTAAHSDDFTPTHQRDEELVEDDTAGGGHSDDSSMSSWSCWGSCWGEDPLGFEENSLEDEDDFFDIFRKASSLHATRLLTPLTDGAECCIVGVPSSLCNPAA
jgi:hypothetical protein